MAGPYFREWRKKRGYTLEQLAGRLAMLDDPNLPQTPASLSRLENGKQPYSQGINEALAAIYEIEVYELIGINPYAREEIERAISELSRMDEVSRRRALKLLEALQDTPDVVEEEPEPYTPPPAAQPPRKKARY